MEMKTMNQFLKEKRVEHDRVTEECLKLFSIQIWDKCHSYCEENRRLSFTWSRQKGRKLLTSEWAVDDVFPAEAASLRKEVQRIVREYQRLFDTAYLMFVVTPEGEDKRYIELLKDYYHEFLGKDDYRKNPVMYRVATDCEMMFGSVKQFMKQMASCAKTATIMFVESDPEYKFIEDDVPLMKETMEEVQAKWNGWRTEITGQSSKLLLPGSIAIVIKQRNSFVYAINPKADGVVALMNESNFKAKRRRLFCVLL